MKQLKDYAEEINKCSKCGLCQAVCPLYKLTGNDCAVSKGKFVMLDGVIKGDLELNKTINKYLEMCLKCGKCSDFCPSGIDVCEIFRAAKFEYLKNGTEGKLIKFLQSDLMFDIPLSVLDKVHSVKKIKKVQAPQKNLFFFKGCANKVSSSSEKAIKKILSELKIYNLIEERVKCCGVPFASSGNLKKFEEVKDYNLNIINSSGCDYVVTDCASCADTISHYGGIGKPVLNFVEFLNGENIKFRFEKPVRVTFHKPCHFRNYDSVKNLLEQSENIEYIEMPDFDECCGFSGQFAITNRKLSKELSRNKIKNALSVKPDVILTACPACLLGLQQGLMVNGDILKRHPKIMNITDFLAKGQPYL